MRLRRSDERPRGRWAVRVARVRGVPVRVHASFGVLVLALLAWALVSFGWWVAFVELLFLALLAPCVILHELAHAAAARRFGVGIEAVTLYPFGGVARMSSAPPSGRAEAAIALAGPAANLAIAAVLFAALGGRPAPLSPDTPLPAALATLLLWSNLLLGLFNLLPAFPLDGGRILRGALSRRLGAARATRLATGIGITAGFVLIAWAAAGRPWLLLVGLILAVGALAERRRGDALERLQATTVADVMGREVATATPWTPVAELAEAARARPLVVFVLLDGVRVVGIASAARILARPGERATTAAEVMAAPGPTLAADDRLGEAVERLRAADAAVAPVADAEGRLVGVVTLRALERAEELRRTLAERY